MKSHVWRPLYVAAGLLAVVLIARLFLVPEDFGIQEQGYMYGWHRKGNEKEWAAMPIKYRTASSCRQCHAERADSLGASVHRMISCENCHGPALNHPEDPPALIQDKSRALCLRCHAALPYSTSGRARIPGVRSASHYPEAECVMCHDPHVPSLKEVRK